MTVEQLIDVLKDLPKDTEVGRMAEINQYDERDFKPFKSITYKNEFLKDKNVKRLYLNF